MSCSELLAPRLSEASATHNARRRGPHRFAPEARWRSNRQQRPAWVARPPSGQWKGWNEKGGSGLSATENENSRDVDLYFSGGTPPGTWRRNEHHTWPPVAGA